MPTAIDEILADLDAAERGLVLGLLAAGGDGGAPAAGVVAQPVADRCGAALRAIGARPRGERVRLMGELAREALAPLPAGIEHIHPDVLRQALELESTDTIRLVVAAGAPKPLRAAASAVLAARRETDAGDGNAALITSALTANAVAELQRAVLSSIVAVPPLPSGVRPKRMGLRLLALPSDAILAELTAAGADLLGTSLGGSDEATIRRAAAHVGAPWSDRIVDAAQADAARTAVEAAGDVDFDVDRRSRARRLVGAVVPGKDPRETLDRLGARAIGDRLAREDPDLAVAVAQRLPPDLGRQLLLAGEGRQGPATENGARITPKDGSG